MYYLGVDGGGTKTNAILTDAHGDDIRTIREGSGNISLLDRGSIAQLIRNLIKGLLKGEPVEKIHKAVFAFAGVGRPEEKSIVKEIIKGSGIKNFSLMTDAELLYYSIFGEKRGMLLSSGTGSICLVRNGKNRLKQVGGRGYLLGDEGSGFDIGNKAIRAAVHDQEMGKPMSVLTKELLSFFGLKEPGELITIMYSSKNPARLTASCAKLVCEEAEKHEPNALKIVDAAARALFELAMEAVPYLEEEALIEIALAGSILKENSIVNKKLKELLRRENLKFRIRKQKMLPVSAAVLFSFRESKTPVSDSLLNKLKNLSL